MVVFEGNTIKIPIQVDTSTDEVIAQGSLSDFDKAKQGVQLPSAGTVASAITQPTSTLLANFKRILPFVGEALIAAGVAKAIIDWAQSPGGPLDPRFRRDIQNEIFGEYTRQEQQARRIGQVQTIIASFNQFRNFNGANVSNSLRQIKQFGHTNFGMLDKAQGTSVMVP